MRVIVLALLAAFASPAGAEPLRSLVLTEPEIVGDLDDTEGRKAWPTRLETLRKMVSDGLGRQAIYSVVDPALVEPEFQVHRGRARVHDCLPCVQSIAAAAGADRVLALYVHRMSRLVLSLHALLRDADGELVYARSLSFRGDTDGAWQEAAEYMLRDIAAIPSDRR